jgi:hypothetical protein
MRDAGSRPIRRLEVHPAAGMDRQGWRAWAAGRTLRATSRVAVGSPAARSRCVVPTAQELETATQTRAAIA